MRNIGNALQNFIETTLHFCKISIGLSAIIFNLLPFGFQGFDIFTLSLRLTDQLAHGLGIGVALLLQAFRS